LDDNRRCEKIFINNFIRRFFIMPRLIKDGHRMPSGKFIDVMDYDDEPTSMHEEAPNRNTATGGRSMAASASAVADVGMDTHNSIDEQLARLNAGLTLQERVARLQKKQTIEEAKEKQQADKVAEAAADDAWVNDMLAKAEGKKPAEEPLSPEDEAWVSDMLKKSGQVRK
jgi:hypothetical protein